MPSPLNFIFPHGLGVVGAAVVGAAVVGAVVVVVVVDVVVVVVGLVVTHSIENGALEHVHSLHPSCVQSWSHRPGVVVAIVVVKGSQRTE